MKPLVAFPAMVFEPELSSTVWTETEWALKWTRKKQQQWIPLRKKQKQVTVSTSPSTKSWIPVWIMNKWIGNSSWLLRCSVSISSYQFCLICCLLITAPYLSVDKSTPTPMLSLGWRQTNPPLHSNFAASACEILGIPNLDKPQIPHP